MAKRQRVFLSVIILLLLVSLGTFAAKLSEETKVEEIARGVKYIEKRWQTDTGWVDIYILEADLTQPGVRIDSLASSNGLANTQGMSTMAREAGAIAAVNADFFLMSSTGVPIGSQVKSGRLIKSPQPGNGGWTAFVVDNDFSAYFGRPVYLTSVTFPDDSRRPIMGINCEIDFTVGKIAVFDEYWGRFSPGRFHNMTKNAREYVEVIVDGNGTVIEVRENLGPAAIPQNGWVLVGSSDEASFLLEKAKVGDPLTVKSYSDPSLEDIFAVVEGQPFLVDKGQILYFGEGGIGGLNPRTAVGISEDGKKVWLVVVDGRSSRSRGFTLKELAEFFLNELGAYSALNLDGGGSSTMVLKKPGIDFLAAVNRPSDGSERRVPNGIGIFIEDQSGDAYNVAIQMEAEGKLDSFRGEIVNIPQTSSTKIKGLAYAADGSLLENAKIEWSIEPEIARIDYGYIQPFESGYATLIARVPGTDIEARQQIHVIDEIVKIEIVPGSLSTAVGQKTPLQVKATDVNGFSVILRPRDIYWDIRGDIGSISEGVFTAEKDMSSGVIVAEYEGHKAGLAVVVGSQTVVLSDFENKKEWSFSTYPSEVTGKLEFTNEQVKSGDNAAKLTYDFTTTTRTRAAYVNNVNIKLSGRPLKLGLWVYGDGNGHWLRGELTDANGVKKVLDFAMNVNWTGWQYVTAEIPQDIDFPLNLKRIYLVEAKADKQGKGAIYLDSLEAVLPQEIPAELLEDLATEVRDPANRPETPADPKKANEFRFVVFGDSKVIAGAPGSQGNQLLSRSIKMINSEKDIDFAIYTGDLIEHDTDENYQAGVAALMQLNVPYKMVIANHEIAKSNNYRNFEKYFGPTYYSFTNKNSYFIILNSAKGGITVSESKQWAWLQTELEKANSLEEIDNVFLAMHIPTYDPNPGSYTGFNPAEAEQMEKLLGEFKYRSGKNVWLFHGHVHGFARRICDGVQYIDSSGSGSSLYLPPKMGGFYHYVIVDVKGDQITYQVYPLIDKIVISPEEQTIAVGEEVTFNAEAFGPAGLRFPLRYPAQAIWSVEDSSVGSIDAEGKFVANKAGTTKITITSGIFTESTTITVK